MQVATRERPSSMSQLNELLSRIGMRPVNQQEVVMAKNLGKLDRLIDVSLSVERNRSPETLQELQKLMSWLSSQVTNQAIERSRWAAAQEPEIPAQRPQAPQNRQTPPPRRDAWPQAPRDRRGPQQGQAAGACQVGRNSVEDRFGQIDVVQAGEAIVQTKVFGGKGAFQFEVVRNNAGRRTNLALMIEAARGENKVYEWANKIVLQCTPEEVVQLVAVLHGLAPACKFNNHGPKNDKGFEILNQGANFFLKAWTGEQNSMVAVPMPRQWAATLGLMLTSLVKRLFPGQSTQDILTTLGRTLSPRTLREY